MISGAGTGLPEESVHTGEGAKFRDLDELSDDDELEMDISSRSSVSDAEEPSKKRVRTAEADESADAAPKWSNPDPYTALPCPDEATRKKRDVVKLIRKARVEENSNKPLVSTEAEDFLSFDLSDDEGEDESDIKVIQASELPPPPPPPPSELPPPPPASGNYSNNNIEPLGRGIHSLPNKPAAPQDRSDPLGSRKRTHDDEIIQPPNYKQFKKPNMKPSKGTLVPNWAPKPNEEPCPWATVDHSATTNMAFR